MSSPLAMVVTRFSLAADDVGIRGPDGHWYVGVGVGGVEDGDGDVPAAVGCHSIHVPDALQVRPDGRHGVVQTRLLREVVTKVVSAPRICSGGQLEMGGAREGGEAGWGRGTFSLSTKVPTQASSFLVSTSDSCSVYCEDGCTSCTSCTSWAATGTCASHTVPSRSLLGPPYQSTRVGTAYLSKRLRDLEPYAYMSMI